MATYNSSRKQTNIPPRVGIEEVRVVGTVLVTTALANLDVLNICDVPAGAVLTNFAFTFSDMDTNVSPTATFDFGDGGDADRYVASTAAGQSAATATMGMSALRAPTIASSLVTVGLGYVYTAADTLKLTVNTGPATGATGTVAFSVAYTMAEPKTVVA